MRLETPKRVRRSHPVLSTVLLTTLCSTGVLAPAAPAQQTVKASKVAGDTRTKISSLPFTIDSCGSYFLSDCLTGVSGQDGITINASDVTLDLNGFSLIGVAGSLSGVKAPGAPNNITIRNGNIVGWGGSGIDANSARLCVYEGLGLKQNGARGLTSGVFATVKECFAFQNGTDGFRIFGGSYVDCVAEQNSGSGFNGGADMTRCTASGNGAHGFENVNNNLSDCKAQSNAQDGFKGGGRFTRCQASSNQGDGFDLGVSQLSQCTATSNDLDGIKVQINGTISNCTSSENDGDGFWVSNQSLIRESCAINNGADGVSGGSKIQVIDCTVTSNAARGIFVSRESTVRGNTCEGNDTGIFALNGGNRIEENNLVNNATGVLLFGAGNLALRNSASASTTVNYDFGTGNSVGPIVDVSAIGDISASVDPNNAHPWANFAF